MASLTGFSCIQINWQKRKRTSTDCGMTSGRSQSAITLAGQLLRWATITILLNPQTPCQKTMNTLSLFSISDSFCHVPFRTVNHQYHLLGSQLSPPKMEEMSSRSATPSAWLSEALWGAAATAVNVCVLLVLFVMPSHLLQPDSQKRLFSLRAGC